MNSTANRVAFRQSPAKKIVLSGLLVAVGVVLPSLIHLSGLPGGPVLLPMHLPVFLAGMLCGAPYGAIVGLILPSISFLITGMPALFPMLPLMTVELLVYGFASGLLYQKLRCNVFVALIGSMLAGRAVNALALLFMANVLQLGVPPVASVITSVVTGLPGIVVQLVLIPVIVKMVKHYETR